MRTRKARVIDTLEGTHSGVIPRHLWVLPWAEIHHPEEVSSLRKEYPNDIIFCPPCLESELPIEGDLWRAGESIDEWGCRFTNIEDGIIGEVKEPMIASWSDIQKLRLPEESFSVDKDQVGDFCKATDAFVIGSVLPRPFERLQWLRGTEQLLVDLLIEPDKVQELLGIVHSFYLKEFEIWCQTPVDALWFMDDWGSQQSMLIAPELWQELFLPCYKDYISLAHAYGKKVFFHSDGYILPIIPHLVEAGLDALNSQIFCMPWDELKAACSGSLTLWGEIDRQHLLPDGSSDQIVQAVHSVYETFYDNGRIIAQMEFGPGANPQNIRTAMECWASIR